MLYGEYIIGGKLTYVILEWRSRAVRAVFGWVHNKKKLSGCLRRRMAVGLLLISGLWRRVCAGGSPKHVRKNTCQKSSKPWLSVMCEIELLTLFSWMRLLVLRENWVVLGPWVWEERQKPLNEEGHTILFLCGSQSRSLNRHLKRWGFHQEMENWRHKVCTPYLFRIPYL